MMGAMKKREKYAHGSDVKYKPRTDITYRLVCGFTTKEFLEAIGNPNTDTEYKSHYVFTLEGLKEPEDVKP